MIEINLVPDVKQELLAAQRIRSTVIMISIFIGLASIGVVLVLAMYVFAVQGVRSSLADRDITEQSDKLSKVKDLSKMLTIQNQLTKISNLNSNKKIGPRIFDLLTTTLPSSPNDVLISDLTIDSTSNTITINGQAANSYAAVEVFKKTLDCSKVKFNTDEDKDYKTIALASNISTSNTSYGEDSSGAKVLRFTISFTYAPELLSPLSKNLSITCMTKGNATDSYLGVPTTIFADRAKDLTGGQ
jgi:hypothetical protein